MDALKTAAEHDFVVRQYAHLVTGGMDGEAARARLNDVLGHAALDALDTDKTTASEATDAGANLATRIVQAVAQLGGNTADAQAALIHSLAEAQLFALDWWRPIRTFLLYILFLLGLAVLVAVIYASFVLPAFSHLDAAMGMGGEGAAAWLQAKGAIRIFAPLVVMAILLALLATLWFRMRRRMARLEPLGPSRFAWLHGHAGKAWQMLLALEYTAILQAGSIADNKTLDPALRLAGWPADSPPAMPDELGKHLAQAAKLGTFDAELEWRRRTGWSNAQSRLELSRDRLILFSRVLFYILIGIMVTVLYIPIFTVAGTFGVH